MGTGLSIEEAAHSISTLVEQASNRRTLQLYWDIGRLVSRADGGYRSNTRATLAELLNKAGLEGLQKENLAKMAKFHETFEREITVQLEQKGVGWRAAAMLCSSHIASRRDLLIESVADGRIPPDDLANKIRKMSGEKAVANTRSIVTAARRATKDIKMIIRLAYSSSLDDELKETAQAQLQKLRNLLDERLA